MTSRERIQTALAHKQPDRVPIDLGGHRSSTFSVQAYREFRKFLGLSPSDLYIHDFIQQLVLIDEDVLDILQVDTIPDCQPYKNRPDYWQDWELQDGTPCKIPAYIDVRKNSEGHSVVYNNMGDPIAIQKKGCLYVEQTLFPYADKDDTDFSDLSTQSQRMMWNALAAPPYPAGFDAPGMEERSSVAKELRHSSDRAIYNIFGGSLLEYANQGFGIDNSLYNLLANPKMMHAFLDKAMENYMTDVERFLTALGDNVDIVGVSDDLGTQNGPLLSPKMFREFFKPRYTKLWGYMKKLNPNIKLCLHSCGSISELLHDIIDAGMDAVNPVQLVCRNMELPYLKKEFGKDITFWGGGCDTRDILPRGTSEQIKEHVKSNLETMSPGGGFVFQQVHNIMADVPPQNVMSMFEAVHEYNG